VRHAARAALAAALAVIAASAASRAGEIPDALIVLEASLDQPWREAASAPPRFVLLRDGQVFVGGTDRLYAGRLEKAELQALEKRAQQVRKLPALGTFVPFGTDTKKGFRLRLIKDKDRPLEIAITGDPSAALPQMQPLASFVSDLARFHHPSLRPFTPSAYALVVREGTLVGGCRAWGFAVTITEALAAPRAVPAAEASGWPTGANPASVCADGRRYVVTLRPLLPGESP
jgi:hypothetical protein